MRADVLVPDGFDRVFETMPPDARASVRRRVLAVAESGASLRRVRTLSARAIAVYLATTLAGSGVAYASSSALPGDSLYVVKIAAEEISIAAAPRGSLRDSLMQQAAIRRVEEIARLADDGAGDERVGAAVGRFEDAAERTLTASGGTKAERAKEKLSARVELVPEPARGRARKALSAGETRASSKSRKGANGGRGAAQPSKRRSPAKGTAGAVKSKRK